MTSSDPDAPVDTPAGAGGATAGGALVSLNGRLVTERC
jgi:hypothetical protein